MKSRNLREVISIALAVMFVFSPLSLIHVRANSIDTYLDAASPDAENTAAETAEKVEINYFEDAGSGDSFAKNDIEVCTTTAWASQGTTSLQVVYKQTGWWPSLELTRENGGLKKTDFSIYDTLEFDVKNTSDETARLVVKFETSTQQADGVAKIEIAPGEVKHAVIDLKAASAIEDLGDIQKIVLWQFGCQGEQPQIGDVTLLFDNIYCTVTPKPVGVQIPMNSFEEDGIAEKLAGQAVQVSTDADWNTDGTQSLRVTYPVTGYWPGLELTAENGGFKHTDLSQFNTLEFDVKNTSSETARLVAKFLSGDKARDGAAIVHISPDSVRHVVIDLTAITNIDMTNITKIVLWQCGSQDPAPQKGDITLLFDNFYYTAEKHYSPAPAVNVERIDEPITIDGVFSETSWKIGNELTYQKAVTEAANNTAKFGAIWDNQNLYFGFDVADSTIVSSGDVWNNDSVDIFIDSFFQKGDRAGNEEKYPQITVGLKENEVYINGAQDTGNRIQHHAVQSDSGYTIEIAIPWSVLGITPQAKDYISCTCYVNDSDNPNGGKDSLLAFTDTDPSDTNTAGWSDFKLCEFEGLENFSQGMQYTWSQSPSETYPDTNYELTDGTYAGGSFTNPAWNAQKPTMPIIQVDFDLGQERAIGYLSVNFLSDLGSGICFPTSLKFMVSNDKENWSTVYLNEDLKDPEDGAVITKKVEWGKTQAENGQRVPTVKARYVRIEFLNGFWVFTDEIEIWGDDDLNRAQTLPIDPPAQKSYAKPGTQTGDIHDLVLAYNQYYENGDGNWTPEQLKPYITYVDRDLKSVDTMFDGVLYLALHSNQTEDGVDAEGNPIQLPHRFDATHGGADRVPGDMADWQWYLDKTFAEQGDVWALNEAAKQAAIDLNMPDYKANLVIMVPFPDPFQKSFGDIDGDGIIENFENLADRQKAIDWYVGEVIDRFQKGNYDRVNFKGFYWVDEDVVKSDALSYTADLTHRNGLLFYWIPYYGAAKFHTWEKLGFDAAAYQPNHFFATSDASRIKETADTAQIFGMGMEIETGPEILRDEEKYDRYLDYLDGAVKYGFQGPDVFKAYYQHVYGYKMMAESTVDKYRRAYDDTYKLIKGTLKLSNRTAVDAPVVQSQTASTITLKPVENMQYSLDSRNWQDSNVFTGLDAGTEYTFYQRIAATDTQESSYASPAVKAKTENSPPSNIELTVIHKYEGAEELVENHSLALNTMVSPEKYVNTKDGAYKSVSILPEQDFALTKDNHQIIITYEKVTNPQEPTETTPETSTPTEPEGTDSETKPDGGHSGTPSTGDTSFPIVLILLIAASVAGIVVTRKMKKC